MKTHKGRGCSRCSKGKPMAHIEDQDGAHFAMCWRCLRRAVGSSFKITPEVRRGREAAREGIRTA